MSIIDEEVKQSIERLEYDHAAFIEAIKNKPLGVNSSNEQIIDKKSGLTMSIIMQAVSDLQEAYNLSIDNPAMTKNQKNMLGYLIQEVANQAFDLNSTAVSEYKGDDPQKAYDYLHGDEH